MRYLKRDPKEKRRRQKGSGNFFSKGEINFLFILIILLVMATIVDLNISFDQVFKFILN